MELREGWARDVASSRFPERVRGCLAALVQRCNALRVQLIRRPERSGPLSVMWVQPGQSGAVHRFQISRIDELCDLDFEQLMSSPTAAPAGPAVYLVCTHGRRDPCCGRHGFAVYQALSRQAAEAEVWQCSHLGGHRFAATALYLPWGLQYGRLEEHDVPAMLTAHAHGRIYDLARVRGQTRYAPPSQTAEIWLREQLGLMAFDALDHLSVEPLQVGRHRVVFRGHTQAHTVTLESRRGMTAQQTSCGSVPPELPTRFEVIRYQAHQPRD